MRPLLAGLLVVTLPMAGCADPGPAGDPDDTYALAWVEGFEEKDPGGRACEWAPDHEVDPANRTIRYEPASPDEAEALSSADRIVATSVSDDGGCPVAWDLHPNPGPVSLGPLNVSVDSDGEALVVNGTQPVSVQPGETWEGSYTVVEEGGEDGERRYRNGSVTVHAFGGWPRDGLVAADPPSP